MKVNFRFFVYGVALSMLVSFVHSHAFGQEQVNEDVYKLWTGGTIPTRQNIEVLKNVVFHTIKKYEPDVDGYRWAHGVAIVRYRRHWVATFGHNKGGENSYSELAQSVTSGDKGKTWSVPVTIDNPEGVEAVSHGVLLNYKGSLWAFQGAFDHSMGHVHTAAYVWNRKTKKWEPQGTVAKDGFWPLQEPHKMKNGQWIMAGASVGGKNPPAVAICKDGNFKHWQVIKIPTETGVWGESSVIVDGSNILLVSRSDGKAHDLGGYSQPPAWVSVSKDYGHTWSELKPSNLPMAASKPYAGILSNGQRYLIGSISSNSRNRRHPLSIAVSKPGENTFSKVFAIRKSLQEGDVESAPNAALSYPYAVEYKKHLWVVYSNDGGRGGNGNSIELAIVPISELKAE